jgi:hypothetical protein
MLTAAVGHSFFIGAFGFFYNQVNATGASKARVLF